MNFPRQFIVLILLASSLGQIMNVLPTYALPTQFSFASAGDWGSSSSARTVQQSIGASGANFAVGVGDYLYSAPTSSSNEQTWCNQFKSYISNVELEVGNHETWETNSSDGGGSMNKLAKYCPFTLGSYVGSYGYRYYYDYPSGGPIARFINIDPSIWNGTSSSSALSFSSGTANYNWVSSAIDGARSAGIPWVIVVMHKIYIGTGQQGAEVSGSFMTMLLNKRVDVIIQGHDHTYQRSKQLTCATDGSLVSSCVAASGSSFTKGAGTVIVIDGTGGVGGGTTSSGEADTGYFQAYCCSGGTPLGYSLWTLTSSTLQNRFVNTGGQTYSDSFTITGTAPSTFTLSSNPSSISFQAGGSGTSMITVASQGGFSGNVALSASITPNGATVSLSPPSVTVISGGTTTSTLTVSSSIVGSYTVTVTGSSGSLTQSIIIPVTVTSTGANPDFTVSAAPTVLNAIMSGTVTSSVSLSSLNGFVGTVALSSSVSPNGPIVSLRAASVSLSSGGSATSTLSFSSSVLGPFNVTVTGASGALVHTVNIMVTVSASIVASDSANGPVSLGVGGGQKLLEDSTGRLIIVYVDSSGRIGISYSTDPMLSTWSTPVKSPVPVSPYSWPTAVIVSQTSLQVFASGGAATRQLTQIPVTIQRDAQNNILGFSFGIPVALDSSGSAAYPSAVLAHNGDILLAWSQALTNSSRIRTLRWDPATGWMNLAGTSKLPDSPLLDTTSLGAMLPDIVERLDNYNIYLFANRLSAPPSSLSFNKASWNGSAWTWGIQNLTYETNASSGVEDPVSSAWDPIASAVVVSYGITGTASFGVFTLASTDLKSHLNTPSLPLTERDWGVIGVHVTTGDYYLFLLNTNTDGGSGTLGYVSHPAGGAWSGFTVLDPAADSQGLSVRATGALTTLDFLYVKGASTPTILKFGRLSPVNPPNFSISSNSTSITIPVNSNGSFRLSLASISNFTGTVSLSSTVSPSSGLAASISPSSISLSSGSGTVTLTVTGLALGTYTVTVTGTSGSLVHSITVVVRVSDYSVSANPSSLNFAIGSSASSMITLTSLNGFSGSVSLSATISPSGATVSLNPTIITLLPGGAGTSTLTVSSSAANSYTVTIATTIGGITHTIRVQVAVSQPPDFAISTDASTIFFNSGSSSSTTIAVTSLSGFAGTLSITSATSPSTGLSVSCSPSSVTLSSGSTATLTCSLSSSMTGIYTLTVSASNSTTTRTTTVTVYVSDYSLTTSTSNITFLVGTTGSSRISLSSLNGFSGPVSLNATVDQGGLSLSLSSYTVTMTSGGSGTSTLIAGSSTVGNYTIMITANGGGVIHTLSLLVFVVDYSISIDHASLTLYAGESGIARVTLTSINGFSGNIGMSLSSSPFGPSASFSPVNVIIPSSGSGTSTLTVSVSTGGFYTLTIIGAGGSISHSVPLTLNVIDFVISASPSTISFLSGSNATSILNLNSLGGFDANVTLNLSASPSNGLVVTCPSNMFSSPNVTSSGTCTIESSTGGVYSVSIVATSGPLLHSTLITVNVGDFSVRVTPSSPVSIAGSSASATVTITSIGRFSGTVDLSLIASSSNITLSMTPPNPLVPAGGSATSTLTLSSNTPGNYTITITGTNSQLIHSITVPYQVSARPKSSYALVTTFTGQVYKLQNGTLTLIGQPVTSALRQIAWRPDGSIALIVGDTAVLLKWDGTSLTRISTAAVMSQGDDLNTVAWRPDGSYAIIGGTSGDMIKYDGTTLTKITDPQTHQIQGISWKPDGTQALLVGNGGALLIYSSNGAITILNSGTTNDLYGVGWNPNGQYALISGANGSILRWNGVTVTALNTAGLYPATTIIRYLAWNSAGTQALLIGNAGGLVLSYDETSLTVLSSGTSNGLFSLAWSGTTATIIGNNGTMLTYTGGIFKAVATGTTTNFRGIAWKPA